MTFRASSTGTWRILLLPSGVCGFYDLRGFVGSVVSSQDRRASCPCSTFILIVPPHGTGRRDLESRGDVVFPDPIAGKLNLGIDGFVRRLD